LTSLTFIVLLFPIMEVNGATSTVWLPIWERNAYRFETSWGWV